MRFAHPECYLQPGEQRQDSNNLDPGPHPKQIGDYAGDQSTEGIAHIAPEAISTHGCCSPLRMRHVANRSQQRGVDHRRLNDNAFKVFQDGPRNEAADCVTTKALW